MRRRKPIRAALAFHGIRIALGVGGVLPRGIALEVFGAGGHVVHLLERSGRERARRNLGLVYGDGRRADDLARRVYRDLGRNAADLARLDRMSAVELERLVDLDGYDRLERAMRERRGVLGITAHLGNWELLAASLGRRGIPLTALASRLFDRRLDERLRRIRAQHGVGSILRSDPGWLRGAIRVLHRGEMLGILMDLRCRREGIVTDFLGWPARTVLGPARLAGRTGSLIVPMACWMVEGGRYRVVIEEPIEPRGWGAEAPAVEESTIRCVRALESFIREAPTQWVWMHDRWGLGTA